MATTELNGAPESTVGPIREALKAAEKARTPRFRAADPAPANAELPTLIGAGGKFVAIRDDESGFEYVEEPTGGGGTTTFLGLTDAPATYSGQAGKMVVVNGTADGLVFQDVPTGGGGGVTTFIALTDVPASYSGQGGKRLAVNSGGTGIEFVDPSEGEGDVIGPASSTDNAIARYDGATGKLLQTSAVTISDDGRLAFVAAAAGYASLNIPHGVAPTTPTDGDVWTTSAGLYVRINGATVGPLGTGGGGSGGLVNFIEALTVASPNDSINFVSLTVSTGGANTSLALVTKGLGGISRNIPDNTIAGGIIRGNYAVDLQNQRTNANQVASGAYSAIGGGWSNRASGNQATVSGGYNNSATGSSATIAGGSGNSASAGGFVGGGLNNNVSTTENGTIGGGSNNTVSQGYATVAGGASNSASVYYAAVGGGTSNTASGNAAAIPGGSSNIASGSNSFAVGANAEATQTAKQAYSAGRFSVTGDAQRGNMILMRATSDATPSLIAANQVPAGQSSSYVLKNNSAMTFRGNLIARQPATGDVKSWSFSGTIKRGANAAATALVGTPVITSTDADAGAADWTAEITADTANGAIGLRVTGEAAKSIRWVAHIEAVEVG